MRITTIATAALVSTMLGLSGAAYAQTMIGNQSVSEADLQRVQTHCDDLKTASQQAASSDVTQDATEPAIPSEGESSAESGALDLESITLEQCIEAGLVEG